MHSFPSLSCINLNTETSQFFHNWRPIDKGDFLYIRLCGKLCTNFHSVAVKEASLTAKLLAKFKLLDCEI